MPRHSQSPIPSGPLTFPKKKSFPGRKKAIKKLFTERLSAFCQDRCGGGRNPNLWLKTFHPHLSDDVNRPCCINRLNQRFASFRL
ncbi:putative agmatinase 1 [Fusarium oxysporum f. sp. albedinis]|nr:putative agmatinase 1 [Fusarium oxysporum f. sp. albedinis]